MQRHHKEAVNNSNPFRTAGVNPPATLIIGNRNIARVIKICQTASKPYSFTIYVFLI